MIDIDILANLLEEKLNADIENTPIGALGALCSNTQYRFRIFSKEGDYKKADRHLNTVTKYINGVVSTLGGEKTGYNEISLVTTARMKLDLLTPDIDLEYDADGTEERRSFYTLVEEYINARLAVPSQSVIYDNNEYWYAIGNYSPVSTGIKDIREAVGNSMTSTVFITYTFVKNGISSAATEIYVNNVRIYPTRIDMTRTSTQESFLPSDTTAPNSDTTISKSKTQGTGFQINIIKPDRFDALDRLIHKYLMAGEVEDFEVKIKNPEALVLEDGEPVAELQEYTYRMIFADITKGLDGVNVPVFNIALVEAFE